MRHLSNHCDLRDRMNFPRGGAPVGGFAGGDVFGLFGVADVEVEPAFEFTPVTDQLRAESFFRPIDSLLSGPVAELWRDLQHDLFAFRRTDVSRNQNVDITTTRTETVRCLRARVSDVNHLPLNPGGTMGGPAISIVTRLE